MSRSLRWTLALGLSTILFAIASVVSIPANGGYFNGAGLGFLISLIFLVFWAGTYFTERREGQR